MSLLPLAVCPRWIALHAAAPTLLHHVAYLQGFAVLIDLHSVRPDLTNKERNQFFLQDLAVNITTVTNIFIMPSTQLFALVFSLPSPARQPWTSSKLPSPGLPLGSAGLWLVTL